MYQLETTCNHKLNSSIHFVSLFYLRALENESRRDVMFQTKVDVSEDGVILKRTNRKIYSACYLIFPPFVLVLKYCKYL